MVLKDKVFVGEKNTLKYSDLMGKQVGNLISNGSGKKMFLYCVYKIFVSFEAVLKIKGKEKGDI